MVEWNGISPPGAEAAPRTLAKSFLIGQLAFGQINFFHDLTMDR